MSEKRPEILIDEVKSHSGRRHFKRRDSIKAILSENFDEYLTGIIHEWLKRLTVWGFTLVPIFFVLDYFIMPEEILFRFGAYRFLSTVVLVAQFFVILHTKVNKWTYLHGHLISLNIAGIIVLMTIDLGGFNSSYYAGLNLVIIAVNLLLPWSMVHSALNCATIIALYLVGNITAGQAFDRSILVNRVIRENISRLVSDHFMTMMAIRFQNSKMMIAGKHQDIVIYRSALNKTETISNRGTWLGVADDISDYVRDVEIPISNGDLVLLFSDGITESENSSGEMYGQKRLEAALNQYADLSVNKIVDKIIQNVKSFQEKQQDDMTLLVLKKLPSEQ
jgi:hypothetical protein